MYHQAHHTTWILLLKNVSLQAAILPDPFAPKAVCKPVIFDQLAKLTFQVRLVTI